MNALNIISVICFLMVMIIGVVFASMYLFRKKFMPYHEVAVGKSWQKLDHEIQTLILALMRVVGGGWLAASAAIAVFIYFLILKGESWSALAIFLTGFAVTVPTLIATILVKTRTSAKPPVMAALLALLLLVTGLLMHILPDGI